MIVLSAAVVGCAAGERGCLLMHVAADGLGLAEVYRWSLVGPLLL